MKRVEKFIKIGYLVINKSVGILGLISGKNADVFLSVTLFGYYELFIIMYVWWRVLKCLWNFDNSHTS